MDITCLLVNLIANSCRRGYACPEQIIQVRSVLRQRPNLNGSPDDQENVLGEALQAGPHACDVTDQRYVRRRYIVTRNPDRGRESMLVQKNEDWNFVLRGIRLNTCTFSNESCGLFWFKFP